MTWTATVGCGNGISGSEKQLGSDSNFVHAAIVFPHLAANLRVGGLRRDGYGVARRCFAAATRSPAPGDPATPRGTTRCALLRSDTFRESETYARLARALRTLCKPCWVAGSPTAGAWALFAPQPAHAQLCSQNVGTPPVVRYCITCNAVHGRAAARIKHRRPRWTVLRPSIERKRAKRASGDAYVL